MILNTISSKFNIKKYLKLFLTLLSKEKISKKDAKYTKNKVKISNIPVVYTVKNNKFISSRTKYNGSFNKEIKMSFKMNFGNFGEYESLALPEEVKNAVEMDKV